MSDANDSHRSLHILSIVALVVVVACVRTTICFESSDSGVRLRSSLVEDTDSYLRLASNWAQTGIYGFEDPSAQSPSDSVTPTAFRPPLLPWLYSWFAVPVSVPAPDAPTQHSGTWTIPASGVAIVNVLLGILTCVFSALVVMRLAQNQLAATVVGLLVAVDPILLRAGQSAMTETLATFLFALAWWLWIQVELASKQLCGGNKPPTQTPQRVKHAILILLLGCVFGISILARPTAAPVVALCIVASVILRPKKWPVRLTESAALCAMVALVLIPWIARNRQQLGKPIWATTHGGYTLLLANNNFLYDHMIENGPSRNWDAEPFHAAWAARDIDSLTQEPELVRSALTAADTEPQELNDDQLASTIAKQNIRSRPTAFLMSCGYRTLWLWAPWPNQGSLIVRIAIGAWYLALFAAAAMGAFRLFKSSAHVGRGRLSHWILPIAIAVSLTAVHSIYWSNMRMRAPVLPSIYAIAAVGLGCQRRKMELTPSDNRPTAD